jgi:hypothetical protein
VGANRKAAKDKNYPVKVFKPTSVDYDARIFEFREKDGTLRTEAGGSDESP